MKANNLTLFRLNELEADIKQLEVVAKGKKS